MKPHKQEPPTATERYISVRVTDKAYEDLRTSATRLESSNSEIIALALAEFAGRRNFEPLNDEERRQLRRRGTLSPEEEAEREEERLFAEGIFDDIMAGALNND